MNKHKLITELQNPRTWPTYFQDSQKTSDTFDCSDFTVGFYFVVARACGVNDEQIIKTKKTMF